MVPGHVHRDQFVKYTSTRTNTTTYFMTVTATGMGAATYPGELSFPVTPPTFIGFKYSSSKLSSNSIPVKSLQTKLIKSSTLYKLEMRNNVLWLNVDNIFIIALFLGRSSIYRGKVLEQRDHEVKVHLEDADVVLKGVAFEKPLAERVAVVIRPEMVKRERYHADFGDTVLKGTLEFAMFTGEKIEGRLKVNGLRLLIYVPSYMNVSVGDELTVTIPWRNTIVLSLVEQ